MWGRWIAAAFVVIVFLIAVGRLVGWLPNEACIYRYNEYYRQEYCERHDFYFFVVMKVVEGINYVAPTLSAIATIGIGLFTFTLWRSTDELWKAGNDQHGTLQQSVAEAKRAADAAQKAADVAITGQRPWIKVSITITSDFAYEEAGWIFGFDLIMTNVGHTPALSVIDYHLIFIPSVIGRHALGDLYVVEEARRLSHMFGADSPIEVGETIFPGDSLTKHYRVMATPAKLAAGRKAELWGIDKIRLYLGGIINYRLTGATGETPFSYQVFDTDRETGKLTFLLPDNGDIPMERLILQPGMYVPAPT